MIVMAPGSSTAGGRGSASTGFRTWTKIVANSAPTISARSTSGRRNANGRNSEMATAVSPSTVRNGHGVGPVAWLQALIAKNH